MQDYRAACQAGMAFALVTVACRQGAPIVANAELSNPACVDVRASAARAPRLAAFAPLHAAARERRADDDIARLAAASCPFGWLGDLDGPDGALARRVFERCVDAEAPLALVCAREGRPAAEDASALVAWAARHPLAREEDGPALQAAADELERGKGPEEALDALRRVSYPRR